MPRPKKPRFVSGYPTLTAFIPQGVPISGEVRLSIEELEAVRLSDFEGLDQEAAANLMEVSRQTYGRILSQARHYISEALITGKALRIEGGDYEFRGMGMRRRRGGGRGPGRGQGKGRGFGRGYEWYPPAAGPAYSMGAAGEMDILRAEADYMKKSLDAINKRIDELSKKTDKAS